MNCFNENKNNSSLFSSNKSLTNHRTCTSCCPYDAKNILHPKFNNFPSHDTNVNENGLIKTSDTCCLSKLQVDCRIQCYKKKRNQSYDDMISRSYTKIILPEFLQSTSQSPPEI